MEIELKITGSGNKQQLIERLREYAAILEDLTEEEIQSGYDEEDFDLCMELKEADETLEF